MRPSNAGRAVDQNGVMTEKQTLQRYLRAQRDALSSKLDGVSEYDVRRPQVPTGTNLLGIVKHVAYVQLGYLGDCFGRPSGIPTPWDDGSDDPDADLWVPAHESRDEIMDLFRRSADHADATLEALEIDAVGEVPWWPEDRRNPTLHGVVVHFLVDVARHAGHADILRENIDGGIGYAPGNPNLPERDAAGWAAHYARVEAAAREAAGMSQS